VECLILKLSPVASGGLKENMMYLQVKMQEGATASQGEIACRFIF
jgi:hypothetical protein